MSEIRRIAAVNDLSGFGRCSLTVAIPILSAMGFQVCPAPTAILSAHTGYAAPHICDFSSDLPPYLRHWEQLGLGFSAVYTGFLGSAAQSECLVPFLRTQKENGALCLVDPVMGDGGKLYSSCTPALAQAMRKLIAEATVITPNQTEACLLTGTEYEKFLTAPLTEAVAPLGEKLLALGCESAVITGLHDGAGHIVNAVVTSDGTVPVTAPAVEREYAGTGDVFAAVLCGHLMHGLPLAAAVEQTAAFISRALAYTAERGLPEQDGLAFEPFLPELTALQNNS